MEPICAIKDIYKILYQFEKNFSEVHAITINEAMLLCCLKDNEAKSAGMICDYIGLSNSRVSKVITSVENKGFIRRNINKEDKRQMFFSLTPKGKEKIQQMMQAELNMDSLFNQILLICIYYIIYFLIVKNFLKSFNNSENKRAGDGNRTHVSSLEG